MQKPDGLTVIHPKKSPKVIENLPIEAFWGVGKVTAGECTTGIHTGKELREQPEDFLVRKSGKSENFLRCWGNDHREVEPDRKRLSVGCEHTFDEDIMKKEQIIARFEDLAYELERRIEKARFQKDIYIYTENKTGRF